MQLAKNYLTTAAASNIRTIILSFLLGIVSVYSNAQVNTVEFGKNRVQFKKFKWAYYQTENFNSYYSQNGEALAKYVAQLAEKELPEIESFTEYGLQRRANIVIYNHFNEMEQSNIGMNNDWQSTGGNTQFVNNKMMVYYNGDHQNLRLQVRQGLARILLDNILFGDDLGEFAANQTLLDLPKWLTDGYVAFAAENWSTDLDDQLKSATMSGSYKNFYQFAFEKPMLAGHAFWHYIAEKYKKENVTYFLYLARVYRNVNGASQRITKMKFKELLKQFMEESEEKYYKDIRARRNAPKGTMSVVEEVNKYKDFFRFTPNPAPRSMTYAMVEFKRGISRVVLYENYVNRKVLLKNGVRAPDNIPTPNYPMMAWDPKGSRLAVIYWAEGKTRLFVYDMNTRRKSIKLDLDEFDQVQDFKFMLDANTLLMSAVKKGQSDIFVYKIDKDAAEQVTNDIYDDLDASFVAFPNKTGIIYSSNRPSGIAITGDTILPSDNRYNIFLVDNWNKSEFKQISKLTDLKYGNARFPMQYNQAHFTFVSDENGIGNRYAGFFSTKRAGVDTIYKIGTDLLRNPDPKDLDSTLKAYNKSEPDSVYSFSITNDSAYIFALTNYQSSLVETKIAGNNGLVSEVRQEGDLKFLYRLKVDEALLKRRNVNPRPTDYRKKTIDALRVATGDLIDNVAPAKDTTAAKSNVFETEFENDKSAPPSQTTTPGLPAVKENENTVLAKAKHYEYKLKFSVDQTTTSLFSNDVLLTRYEPYTGSLPITPGGGGLNGLIKLGVIDIMEDLRFTGMFRLPLINTAGAGVSIGGGGVGFTAGTQSLFNSGSEYLGRVDYLKHRFDYSAIYYRKTDIGTADGGFPAKQFTNLYQAIVKYPFDKVKSLRMTGGIRMDKFVLKSVDPGSLEVPDLKRSYALVRLEYVYDNVVTKATNIMNGLRYKVYGDLNTQINDVTQTTSNPKKGRNSFNLGFDGRYYYPIFRNFIWAGRAAGDFSWGDQKILYYLGGSDGWLLPKVTQGNTPQDSYYAYQALAVNMRGFNQNIANGNNALVLNSEFRLPVFATLFNRPINNAFLRNFQITQFFDLGSAWNGKYNKIGRPSSVYPNDLGDALVKFKAGGIGPFVGGYGFGARSTLLGYFLRLDAGWEMNGFFRGKPILYFGMGVDF